MSLLHEVEAHVSTRRLRPRYFIHSIGELHDVGLLVLAPSSTYHTAVDAVVHCSGILYFPHDKATVNVASFAEPSLQ